MEVRHNERYRRSLSLVRAHADALEVQHHEMLLALDIQHSPSRKLSTEENEDDYVPNNAGIGNENKTEILCSSCGLVFFNNEFEQHECDIPPTPAVTSEYPQMAPSSNYITYTVLSGAEFQGFYPSVQYQIQEYAPLDFSCQSNMYEVDSEERGRSEKCEDPPENVNAMSHGGSWPMTLLSSNVSVESKNENEQPLVFTFQDLLVLEQNLAPIYL